MPDLWPAFLWLSKEHGPPPEKLSGGHRSWRRPFTQTSLTPMPSRPGCTARSPFPAQAGPQMKGMKDLCSPETLEDAEAQLRGMGGLAGSSSLAASRAPPMLLLWSWEEVSPSL